MRRNILLLAGGQSGEHEVSLRSAKSVLGALPKDQFNVTPLVITTEGHWLSVEESEAALEAGEATSGGESVLRGAAKAEGYDVIFPLLHGPMGEDGTIQGLLTLAGMPFVGSGVLGSAVGMDKIMTKRVLASAGIPQVAWDELSRYEWQHSPEKAEKKAAGLGFPLFVKPANLGSSVGISKVNCPEELTAALQLAFAHDRRVILEAMTAHKPREVEIGILGNEHPMASVVGELTFDADFYDYDTKYTAGQAQMHIPADLPEDVSERIREWALQAFAVLDCAGLARVDFFYVPQTGDIFLNEINTMPGFTATSMYPSLFEAVGVPYEELVTRLVELALQRHSD